MMTLPMSRAFSSMIPGYRLLCLLSSAAAVMLLLAWSQQSDVAEFAARKYVHQSRVPPATKGPNAPPILAYWISGSRGDSKRILRLLRAVYHPRNQYLLHLDSSSSHSERSGLAIIARTDAIFGEFGNVNVVGKSYAVNRRGSSGLAAMLHAAAMLLRISRDWDWFVPLSAFDYPIYTQDDILYAFSHVSRDLNFVGYGNDTALTAASNRIAVDPSLYLKEQNPIFYAEETRQEPDAFKRFHGSPWMMLSRGFLDLCVTSGDNLPRKLLMYFNNVAFPLESYFQTVLCNTPEFQNATVNHSLRYNVVKTGTNVDKGAMLASATIFAGEFTGGDAQLQEIDKEILNRDPDKAVVGKWCMKTGLVANVTAPAGLTSKKGSSGEDFCKVGGDINTVEGGNRGIELKKVLLLIIEEKRSIGRLCGVIQNQRKKRAH